MTKCLSHTFCCFHFIRNFASFAAPLSVMLVSTLAGPKNELTVCSRITRRIIYTLSLSFINSTWNDEKYYWIIWIISNNQRMIRYNYWPIVFDKLPVLAGCNGEPYTLEATRIQRAVNNTNFGDDFILFSKWTYVKIKSRINE